jgi:hypothetical protein
MNSNSKYDEVVLIAFEPDAKDRILSIIKQLQPKKTNKQQTIAEEEKKVLDQAQASETFALFK